VPLDPNLVPSFRPPGFGRVRHDAARSLLTSSTQAFLPLQRLNTPPQLDHELLMPIQLLSSLAFVCLGNSSTAQHTSRQQGYMAMHHSGSTTSHPSLHTQSQPNDLLILVSHARPNHLLRRRPGQLQPAAGCPGLCHALGLCDSFPRRHCWYVALVLGWVGMCDLICVHGGGRVVISALPCLSMSFLSPCVVLRLVTQVCLCLVRLPLHSPISTLISLPNSPPSPGHRQQQQQKRCPPGRLLRPPGRARCPLLHPPPSRYVLSPCTPLSLPPSHPRSLLALPHF